MRIVTVLLSLLVVHVHGGGGERQRKDIAAIGLSCLALSTPRFGFVNYAFETWPCEWTGQRP